MAQGHKRTIPLSRTLRLRESEIEWALPLDRHLNEIPIVAVDARTKPAPPVSRGAEACSREAQRASMALDAHRNSEISSRSVGEGRCPSNVPLSRRFLRNNEVAEIGCLMRAAFHPEDKQPASILGRVRAVYVASFEMERTAGW